MSRPLAVSIVVPVYNPGPNLARCMDSLLAQTMPAGQYEIICVDDGSTDGSGRRLDELAAQVNAPGVERLRVIHTPNSGWPGVPRNIGVREARGKYIHFVDNDDVLPPYTLADFYDAALADQADVVLGRPVSDFRGVNHALYRADLRAVTLAEHPELAEALTPHRMFRRDMLLRHDIRFPDRKVPLEDHPFVLGAYLAARSITLLTGKPYYYYLRRIGSGRNAGDEVLDIGLLADPVGEVAELVAARAATPQLADWVLRRELRLVLLSRLTAATFADAGPADQQAVITLVRDLLTERLGGIDGPAARGLGAVHRALIRSVMGGDPAATRALCATIRELRPVVQVTGTSWRGAALAVTVDGALYWREEPLRCVPGGPAARWALPEAFAAPLADRLIGAGQQPSDAELSLVHRATWLSYGLTEGVGLSIEADGQVRISGTVLIDPDTAAAGGPLDEGVWELGLRLRWESMQWQRSLPLPAPSDDAADPLAPPLLGRRALWPHRSARPRTLALDIGQTIRSLARVLAATAQCTVAGRRGAQIRLGLVLAGPATAEAELLLEPEPGTAGGLLTLRGTLVPGSAADGSAAGAVCRIDLPAADAGRWRLWLRLDPAGAAVPEPLPWRVVADRGRWSAEPV